MRRSLSDSEEEFFVSKNRANRSSADDSQITRIVVEPLFGSAKCVYNIDKSQPGRLIVEAQKQSRKFPTDYFSSKSNQVLRRTYRIPSDSDLDKLQSHVDRRTNQLIIEIPRVFPVSTRKEVSRYRRRTKKEPSNLEFFVDCQGYRPSELDVFLDGKFLVVESRTRRGRKILKEIGLPSSVDTSRIVSFYERGQLRIDAPLKNLSSSYHDISDFSRFRSRTPPSRQNFHDFDYPKMSSRRIRSHENLSRPIDELYDADRRRRTIDYHRANQRRSRYRPNSIYSPDDSLKTADYTLRRTTYRSNPSDDELSFRF